MKILKIKTLEKGWQDREDILLHAAFQCLVDFVEQEIPTDASDWDHDKSTRRALKEMRELYKWWTEERPSRKDPLDAVKAPPFKTKKIPGTDYYEILDHDHIKYADWDVACEESSKLEQEWLKEDQRNLHRLVKIRLFLWT